jgi:hypothetical protein
LKQISIFIILFFSVINFSSAQNIDQLDTEYGFRGHLFGSELKNDSSLRLISGNKEYQYYTCKDDSLKMGEFPLREITYGFYKDSLFWISIKVAGYKNSRGVLRLLESSYG